MPSITQLKDHVDTLQWRAKQIYQEATEGGNGLDFSAVKSLDGTPDQKIAEWQRIQIELGTVKSEYEQMRRIEAELKNHVQDYERENTPVNMPALGESKGGWNGGPMGLRGDGLRALIDHSPEFKVLAERKTGTARIEIPNAEYKTLINLAGISPQNDRQAMVRMGLETRTVIDMIGESQANSSTVEWYEETTFTNAAVETAEGEAKPEAALAWTLRTSPVKTIATWIPVTVQALDDNDFLESEIRNRLMLMVQRREEQQVLTGNAVGENLRGITATANVQTQAKGADSTATAVFKALQKVRGAAGVGFAEPDGIVMHPNDYTEMYNAQATTGEFIMQAILQQTPDNRLWGLPIRQTTGMTENTGLVGAFAFGAEVWRRGGLSVAASTEHASYFIENKVAIRAESRIALAVNVPAAFCLVTGI